MIKLYLNILVLILVIDSQAQNFDWSKREGWWAYDYGYGISTDASGNIYVAGKYEMEAVFSGVTLIDRGNHDTYVAQYSPSGTLNWIKTSGGVLGDYAHTLACDGANVYIAGEIEGWGDTITFEGSPVTLYCIGDNDVFLAKYDVNGNLLWAKSEGWYKNEKALGITYDNLGNVYICGTYRDTTYFNGTRYLGYGNRDLFVAKYDMNGNFQWVQTAGGPGREEALGIQCDASGNVYVCGMHSDAAAFGSQLLSSPNGYYNSFLAKYAPDGTLAWVKTAGGDYDEVAWGITIDNDGKIYITGEFNAYALFDAFPLTTTGNADVFIACYDPNGNVQWVSQGGGKLIDRARGIGTDGTYIYITGQFGDTATFGATTLIGIDSSEIFMAALNNAGSFLWAAAVGGIADSVEMLSYESGNDIAADSFGNVFATGALLDGGIFGSTSHNKYGRTDAFLAKITQPVSIRENIASEFKDGYLFPNPNNGNFIVDIEKEINSDIQISVYDCLGQMIYQKTFNARSELKIDISEKKSGVYFIEVRNGTQLIMRNKIILQ